MLERVSGIAFGGKGWYRSLFQYICLVFVIAVLFPSAAISRSADKLVDDDEYKDKEFHRGIITDYSDMVRGDEVNWSWFKPGDKLSDYNVKVTSIENKSDMRSRVFADSVKSIFEDYLANMKGTRGTLTADLCITEVQEYSPGKAYIPFAGGHQMQAGIGMEIVLRDQSGNIVAKLRDFERRGSDPKQAAEEVAGRMAKEMRKH
jgi:DNA-binding protein Fis